MLQGGPVITTLQQRDRSDNSGFSEKNQDDAHLALLNRICRVCSAACFAKEGHTVVAAVSSLETCRMVTGLDSKFRS